MKTTRSSSSRNPIVWVRRSQEQEGDEGDDEQHHVPAHLIFEENSEALVEFLSSSTPRTQGGHEWVPKADIRYRSPRSRRLRPHHQPSSSLSYYSSRSHNKQKSLVSKHPTTATKLASDYPPTTTTSTSRVVATASSATRQVALARKGGDGDEEEEEEEEEGDDEEEEVEVLLTILPPSPKKKKIMPVITPATTNTRTSSSSSGRMESSKTAGGTEEAMAGCDDSTSSTTKVQQHPQHNVRNSSSNNQDVSSPIHRRVLWSNENPPIENKQQKQSHKCQQDDNNNRTILQETSSTKSSAQSAIDAVGCCSSEFTDNNGTTTSSSSTSPPNSSNSLSSKEDGNDDDGGGVTTNNNSKSPGVPSPPSKAPQKAYTFRSSAYLQSLAEICYSILWDVRWRTHQSQYRPLMSWEKGDDLSVVYGLANRYIPLVFPKSEQQQQQQQQGKNRNHPTANTESPSLMAPTTTAAGGRKSRETQDTSQNDTATGTSEENVLTNKHTGGDGDEDAEDEAYDRALNLYCRLYTRKGPWFRIDDVFKYYLPKSCNETSGSVNDDADATTANTNTNTTTTETSSTSAVNNISQQPISPTKFFLPRKQTAQATSSLLSSSSAEEEQQRFIDTDAIDQLLDCAKDVIVDLKQLYYSGWIRSFKTERECGLSVGEGGSGGTKRKYNGLLRQEEQQRILSKLGGSKRPKNATVSCSSNSKTSSSTITSNTNENLIWKQMCQQTSISSLMAGMSAGDSKSTGDSPNAMKNSNKCRLLPVSKHVDDALLQSWATAIVMKASRVDYLPSSIVRGVVPAVKGQLLQLLATMVDNGYDSIDAGSKSDKCMNNCVESPMWLSKMCFRLREAPLQTLRRSCRLYLCATSGPGDMRGTGSNAWRSLPDSAILGGREANEEKARKIPPKGTEAINWAILDAQAVCNRPGSGWHTISYPGRDHRFKLRSCNFLRAHEPLIVSSEDESSLVNGYVMDNDQLQRLQVFPTIDCFLLWEICVEIRANVDYLIELNELAQYPKRKRAREDVKNKVAVEEEEDHHQQFNDEAADLSESTQSLAGFSDNVSPTRHYSQTCGFDFLNVLTATGRGRLLESFFATPIAAGLQTQLETEVDSLLGKDCNLDSKKGLKGDSEIILGVIATICIHILSHRSQSVTQDEIILISSRPWLRHLRWEGCMAYVLWDIIPIIEKRGYHSIAVKSLEVLLFGHALPRRSSDPLMPSSLASMPIVDNNGTTLNTPVTLSDVYLSRRARGKAYERLMIDYVHVIRQQQKEAADELKMGTNKTTKKSKPPPSRTKKKQKGGSTTTKILTANDKTAELCKQILRSNLPTGQITFSAARTLARRLKQPLLETLSGLSLFEPELLGHRLSNDSPVGHNIQNQPTRYKDWMPLTDFAVANSMSTSLNGVGRRCSYIGLYEDDDNCFNQKPRYESLNVETLAMEYYYSGKLPEMASNPRGGWVGWHDEGGKIRTIFRVLSAAPILGMDWGYSAELRRSRTKEQFDWATIYPTPWVGAPFDLHVGAELCAKRKDIDKRGFYGRRKQEISAFLDKLARSTPDDLSRLVYDSIEARLIYAKETGSTDSTLERDVQQVRTLSFVAAGLGGHLLSAIFRNLYFDYRHYSGGLPDLLLVRGLYADNDAEDSDELSTRLVDLGDWIGEAFSAEHQSEENVRNAMQMFEDRDEDFLGCNKVGDSGGRSRIFFQRRARPIDRDENKKPKSSLTMPNRMDLSHGGRRVIAESLFVEVKSQNDRLDARQEDWLNVLDLHGNARVCKFGKAKEQTTPSKKKKTK